MQDNKIDYCQMSEYLYSLIDSELTKVESNEAGIGEVYPKLVVCVEFFRYIRGEFFLEVRPSGLSCQDSMYEMENKLGERVRNLRLKLDLNDSKNKYYLDLAKKIFD